jgi:hypothetical protein
MFTICFSLQEKYKEEVVKQYNEDFNYEEEPIDGLAVYASGGGKAHGQWGRCIIFFNFVNAIYGTFYNCWLFFLKVCSVQWGARLQGGNAVEAKFIVHIFWSYASCISDTLKLWDDGKLAQNDARRAVEQEDHRETWQSVNACNA